MVCFVHLGVVDLAEVGHLDVNVLLCVLLHGCLEHGLSKTRGDLPLSLPLPTLSHLPFPICPPPPPPHSPSHLSPRAWLKAACSFSLVKLPANTAFKTSSTPHHSGKRVTDSDGRDEREVWRERNESEMRGRGGTGIERGWRVREPAAQERVLLDAELLERILLKHLEAKDVENANEEARPREPIRMDVDILPQSKSA